MGPEDNTKDSPLPKMPRINEAVLPLTPAKELQLRQAVIDEAVSWVRTPYIQQGYIKGVAIDCSMLLVAAWVGAGIVHPFDPRPYPPNWHMHQDRERYLEWMQEVAEEITEEQAKPGDVILYQFGRCFSHAGIITRPGQIVHAIFQGEICSLEDTHHVKLKWYDNAMKRPRPTKYFDVFARIRKIADVRSRQD